MTIIAALPPALLWAASLAASDDPTKGPICAIEARLDLHGIRLAAVDGHRCFRTIVPLLECHFVPEDQPLRLAPKAFSKAPGKKAVLVEIDDGGVAFFKDKAGNVLNTVSWLPDKWAHTEQAFPNIDQIWPDKDRLSCNPSALVAMNASYVADFMKIVNKIGDNCIARLFTTDSPTSPLVWESLLDNNWLAEDCSEEVWLQYLLMPVQLRLR